MHPVNHIDDPYIGFNVFDLIPSIKTKMTCHDKKVASFYDKMKSKMKKKIITGFIFITLAILLITIGVWFAISGINSGNINFIAGPLVGVLFINGGIGFMIL